MRTVYDEKPNINREKRNVNKEIEEFKLNIHKLNKYSLFRVHIFINHVSKKYLGSSKNVILVFDWFAFGLVILNAMYCLHEIRLHLLDHSC